MHRIDSYDNEDGEEHGEIWFTDHHNHDIGAVNYNWYYILPFAPNIIGFKENLLVNENKRVADERGVAYIKIIPQEYTGNQPMVIQVI